MSAEDRRARILVEKRRTRRYVIAIISVAVVGGFAISYLTQGLRTQRSSPATISIADYRARARVDDRLAPPFALPALHGGRRIALADYLDKVVVLNFWASWCGPCREEAPGLKRLWAEYRNQDVQFLGINHQDNRAAAREYEREFGITYPSVFDPTGELAFDYGLFGLPSTFMIGRDGRIKVQFTGIVTESLLRNSLDEVLTSEQA